MDTNDSTTPETEVETPTLETTAAPEPLAGDEDSEPLDGDEQPTEPEFEEIEIDGLVYKVPKELKPLIMTRKDYTQKSQATAEERKAVAAEREALQRTAAEQAEFMEAIVATKQIEAQLDQFSGVDWQQLSQVDPQKAQSLWFQYQQLRDAHNQVTSELDRKQQEKASAMEREIATSKQKALEALNKPDPATGWPGQFTTEHAKKLTDFGRSMGFTDQELATVNNPQAIKTLHLAMLGKQFLEQQRKASAPPKVQAEPVREIGTAKGGNVIRGLDDKLAPEEWVKRREEQLRKRSAR